MSTNVELDYRALLPKTLTRTPEDAGAAAKAIQDVIQIQLSNIVDSCIPSFRHITCGDEQPNPAEGDATLRTRITERLPGALKICVEAAAAKLEPEKDPLVATLAHLKYIAEEVARKEKKETCWGSEYAALLTQLAASYNERKIRQKLDEESAPQVSNRSRSFEQYQEFEQWWTGHLRGIYDRLPETQRQFITEKAHESNRFIRMRYLQEHLRVSIREINRHFARRHALNASRAESTDYAGSHAKPRRFQDSPVEPAPFDSELGVSRTPSGGVYEKLKLDREDAADGNQNDGK